MSQDLFSELPPLTQPVPAGPRLGSLAQSARKKQLKTARIILIIVGILTVAGNGLMLGNVNNEVDRTIQKQVDALRAQGQQADGASVAEFRDRNIRYCRIIYGSALVFGVVFIALGIAVYTYPVPCTVLALVLYVGAAAIYGFLSPETLKNGMLVKIVIIIALAKSVQAAVAYRKA
ncbi:MAG: hypothetical protein ABFC63_09880 [Thermoguttaceae bacterium]